MFTGWEFTPVSRSITGNNAALPHPAFWSIKGHSFDASHPILVRKIWEAHSPAALNRFTQADQW